MSKFNSRAVALIGSLVLVACAAESTSAGDGEWKSLFDGKTLDGWVTKGGHYDGDARWTIEDGAITGRQNEKKEGGLIYTAKMYANFEFECDCKCDWPFDSGIFPRMVPDELGTQITIDYRPDGELGAIYSDAFLQHNPDGWKLWKKDAWNHFKIVFTGRDYAVDTWCNGQLLESYRMPEGSTGFAPTGRIGLQVHGGADVPLETKVQFKNIRIHELPVADEPLTITSKSGVTMLSQKALIEGWRPIFDGKSLDGWEINGPKDGVEVKDGTILVASGGGDVHTKADYKDFELSIDFQISKLCNSGVFLRGERSDKDPAFSGCEIQVIDDYNWEAAAGKLEPWQHCGSLYASVPANAPGVLKLAPDWNNYHITFQGSHLKTVFNGKTLYDVDTKTVPLFHQGSLPFEKRAPTGFIGLQRHGAANESEKVTAAFKNIFVRKL